MVEIHMVFLRPRRFISHLCLLVLLACLEILTRMSSASAAEINGFNICADDYALCSAATCRAVPDDPGHAICQCEGPFRGLNIGHSSCKARTQMLTSTFSVQNQFWTSVQKPLHMTQCTGDDGGRWADCLDAACTTDSGSVVCDCPVKTSDFFFLGAHCADSAAGLKSICSQIRSGASIQHNNQKLMSSFYGNPPDPLTCSR